jgi:hypothetical protein
MVYSEARRLRIVGIWPRMTMVYALERESDRGSTKLALEDVPRGRPAEPLVRLVDRGQQLHVGRSVMALETGP